MKRSITALLLTLLPGLVCCAGGFHIGPDGALLDADNKPAFSVGVVMGFTIPYQVVRYGSRFRGRYPDRYRWIYENQPDSAYFKQFGFHSITPEMYEFSGLRWCFPDYERNRDMDEYEHQQQGLKNYFPGMRMNFKSREAYELGKNAAASWKDMIVIPGYDGFEFREALQQPFKLFTDQETSRDRFSPSRRNIAFQLGSPQGRATWMKVYRNQFRWWQKLGITPFAFRVLCECRYQDGSAANRKRFVERLKRKFVTVEAMNRAWDTSFQRFEDTLKNEVGGRFRPLPVEIEYCMMEQEQVTQTYTEMQKEFKKMAPESHGLTIQINGYDWYRKNINNFDLYSLFRPLEVVSPGTGNYTFSNLARVEDGMRFRDAPDIDSRYREALIRDALFRNLSRGKLLVNLEAYHNGAKNDPGVFNALLWRELATGKSIVHFHALGGMWRWRPDATGIPSYSLQNPGAVMPQSFEGIWQMQRESKGLLDIFAARGNFPEAEIAVLFSRPTVLLNHAGNKKNDSLPEVAVPLTFQHYPFDMLFEEELTGKTLDKYRILCAFGVEGTYPETLPLLKQYVENGGVLVVSGGMMDRDQYGKQIPNPLLDGAVPLFDANAALVRAETFDINIIANRYFRLSGDWSPLLQIHGKTVFACRDFGRGKVYLLGGEMQDYARAELLKTVFRKARRLADVTEAGTTESVPNIEVIRRSAGKLTGWYLCNNNSTPKLVRFSAPELRGAVVANPLDGVLCPVDGDGVLLWMEPAKRLILVTGPAGDIRKRFGTLPERSPEELRNAQSEWKKRGVTEVRPSVHVSLEKVANAGMDNNQGYAVDTVFVEDGKRELRNLPFHESAFGDLKFDIIRFDYVENKTCLALRSRNFPGGAARCELPLNGRFSSVAFLLSGVHVKPGETAAELRFHYHDGKSATVPLVAGNDFGSWLQEKNTEELNRRAVWKHPDGAAVFRYEWFNPDSGNPLKSLEIVSRDSGTVPVIIAVTACPSVYKKSFRHRLDLTAETVPWSKDRCSEKDGVVRVIGNHPVQAFLRLTVPEGKRLSFPMDKLKKAVLRYSVSILPDKFGVVRNIGHFVFSSSGKLRGKNAKTHPVSITYCHEGMTPMLIRIPSPSVWHEGEYELFTPACTGPGRSEPLEEIRSFDFSMNPNVPFQLNFVRLEWDD